MREWRAISENSSDRRLSHGLHHEKGNAHLGNCRDTAAKEADEHTLGNKECANGCSMILKGDYFATIFLVDGSILISTWVTELRESVDSRDDDAGKVSATSTAVSNTTDECKWREDGSETGEDAEDGEK